MMSDALFPERFPVHAANLILHRDIERPDSALYCRKFAVPVSAKFTAPVNVILHCSLAHDNVAKYAQGKLPALLLSTRFKLLFVHEFTIVL